MTHAVAIGYDWLYAGLTPEDRKRIRAAIVEKGIDAALPLYRARKGFTILHHNWNQVCNGGIAIGALAVAEDEAKKAREVLSDSIASIPLAMDSYAPDGGWAGALVIGTTRRLHGLLSGGPGIGARQHLRSDKTSGIRSGGRVSRLFQSPPAVRLTTPTRTRVSTARPKCSRWPATSTTRSTRGTN